jgi:hypothetical protein
MLVLSVDKVETTKSLCDEISTLDAIQKLTRREIEACSEPYSKIVACDFHPLVSASHIAYDKHLPLVISPDMIWLTIAQGVACHVNNNAEKLRKQFVKHGGKEKIVVRRDEFRMGSKDNDWAGVFNEFSEQIQQKLIPTAYSILTPSFSTTGSVEKISYEITIMDTVKNYFQYTLKTLCGIPEVIVEGKVEDWEKLQDKVESLKNQFGLEWWIEKLLPVVTGMLQSVKNKNGEFWKNWYKLSGSSGGPYIHGHITKLFPYKKSYESDDLTEKSNFKEGGFGGEFTSDSFSGGLCSTPMIWEYYLQQFQMNLMSGFVGYTQDKKTKSVRPKIGWAVMNVDAPFCKEYISVCTKCKKTKMIEEFSYKSDEGKKLSICNDCYFG